MWEWAAWAPSAVRPTLSTTTGLTAATAAAASSRRRARGEPSRYMPSTRVPGSAPRASRPSMMSTSAMLPTVRKRWKPTPPAGAAVQDMSSQAPTAPLWETKEIPPGRWEMSAMKVVSIRAAVSITPTQLGPSRRMPCRRQKPASSSWWPRPSSLPTSAKPAAEQITARMSPRAARRRSIWATTPGVAAAGAAMTTSSTGPGTRSRSGQEGRPRISSPAGLMGARAPG